MNLKQNLSYKTLLLIGFVLTIMGFSGLFGIASIIFIFLGMPIFALGVIELIRFFSKKHPVTILPTIEKLKDLSSGINKKIYMIFKINLIKYTIIFLLLINLFLILIIARFIGLNSCFNFNKKDNNQCNNIKRMLTKDNLSKNLLNINNVARDLSGSVNDLENRVMEIEEKIKYKY